jgi:hypothetical protein
MELKGKLVVAPAACPLLSLQSTDLYCVFRASPLLRHKITSGEVYIVDFVGIQSRKQKNSYKPFPHDLST